MTRDYDNCVCCCPKCNAIINMNEHFDSYTVFGDYYAGRFMVFCDMCDYEFDVERCVLITYEVQNVNIITKQQQKLLRCKLITVGQQLDAIQHIAYSSK